MGALAHVEVPGYAAILFRRTYQDLALPGALIPRSHEWLDGTPASWDGVNHTWRFPAGSFLRFGYLQHAGDEHNYRSAEFQFEGFDELTQLDEAPYRYVQSRLRRPSSGPLSQVPLQVRSASNPGGRGHEWVKRRFLDFPEDRAFMPSRLDDNPYIDQESYLEVLRLALDDVTLAQLLGGDWRVKPVGGRFDRRWVKHWEPKLPDGWQEWRWVRYWDLAATEAKAGTDPDYTAGALMGLDEQNEPWLVDVVRQRLDPGSTEDLIVATALADRLQVPYVEVRMEQEPGSAGVVVIDHFSKALRGFAFEGIRSTGPKEVRALAYSTAMSRGAVHIVDGAWVGDYFDEAESFPTGAHDDQVDASAGAFNHLAMRVFEMASASGAEPVHVAGTTPYHARRRTSVGYRRLTHG